MSRNPADDETPLPPHGKAPAAIDPFGPLPCRLCGMLTQRAMLAQYGARCLNCYELWRGESQPSPYVGDKRVDGPKAWAHALKAREQAGERLSIAQRTMWREALGLPITGAIATWEQTPEEYANGHPNPTPENRSAA